MEFQAIAVIDQSTSGLFIYDVESGLNHEQTEEFISEQGHHLSNCSWGEFDGSINDLRNEE